MILIAIANGTVREFVYGPRMSTLAAHQLSTLTALVLFTAYTWALAVWMPLAGVGQALRVGLMWLVMTIAFEFVFGRYVAGHSWAALFADYNIFKGRVWVLIPVAVFILPYLVHVMRR